MRRNLLLRRAGTALLVAGSLQLAALPAAIAQSGDNEPLAVELPGSGDYSRPITTDSERAQQFFDQGLRMAWSFYFPESIASYQEAARHDPDAPMVWFGMAHAMGPNPNSRYANMPDDPQGEGLKAIEQAMELIDNASEREQDMIRALYVLYNKDAIPDDSERDFAYLDAMAELHERYPDDPDIASLYAAAYMSMGRWDYWNEDGSARPGTARAQSALEQAMRVEPYHPGANHLYIHLMEASTQPELAMPAAQKLERTAPISGHMVHMPGHIYLRVGEYEKAINTNIRSQEVDLQFADIWGDTNFPMIGTYPLSHRSHSGHAQDFVRYAASLQGNHALSAETAEAGASSVPADGAQGRGQKRVVSAWLVDKIFGQWDTILEKQQSHDGTAYLDGMWQYVTGSARANIGDVDRAEAALAEIRRLAEHESVDQTSAGPTPVSHILRLAAAGLEGEIAEARGDLDAAIAAYERAVELEDQNNYTEPPDWPQSMRLYLGAALLEAGDAERAEAIYRRDLEWNQRNGWATFGLAQALEAQGKQHEADIVWRQFETLWRNADVELERSRLY